ATRAGVQEAMRQVGYVPNSAARALKRGSFRTIGIVAHQLARTGESSTVEAVVESARRRRLGITLVDVQSPTTQEVNAAAAGLAPRSVDGLNIIRAESVSPEELTLPARVPGRDSESHSAGHYPAVATDQRSGTRQAVEHLLDLGHRTVTHVGGPNTSLPAVERESAWRERLQEAGCQVPAVLHSDWTAASGFQIGTTLEPRIRSREITAVFCANDQVALGLYRAIYEAGLRIPEDVSVVGFDDIPEAAQFWPPLTSVSQDFRAVGQQLVTMLDEQITSGESPAEHVLLPVELMVRASTGPPPSAPPSTGR